MYPDSGSVTYRPSTLKRKESLKMGYLSLRYRRYVGSMYASGVTKSKDMDGSISRVILHIVNDMHNLMHI